MKIDREIELRRFRNRRVFGGSDDVQRPEQEKNRENYCVEAVRSKLNANSTATHSCYHHHD